jgi:glycosyltransferase involved in cell wall biosynthesis
MDHPRIVIVAPAHPYRGGQALVESHLFETLTDLGYDCHTVSFKLLYPSFLFPGTTQFDESERIYNDHTGRITRVINSIDPFSWLRAGGVIARLDPRVVVFVWWMPFFGPSLGTVAWLVRRRTRARVVFLVENYVSHENRWFDHAATRATLRLADHFIAESRFVADKLEHAFPATPIHRTTLPVYDCYNYGAFDRESARRHLGISTKNVVLFFGYIRPYKGLDNLIRATSRVVESEPDTTLLIVGESYEDRRKYDELIASEGLSERTRFVCEYVANEAVEPYFKAADVVCLPYKSASQSGIVMMAYGFRRPVVTTDVGGLPEFVRAGETGEIVPPGDVEALADAVVRALRARGEVDFEGNIERLTHELGHANVERIFSHVTG